MSEKAINTYAVAFAAKVKGAIETYRGLHIVTYDLGSSPSLSYWKGQQTDPTDSIHFFRSEVRNDRILKLKEARDRELTDSIWTISTTYSS